jgi:FkbM family methyltransferase
MKEKRILGHFIDPSVLPKEPICIDMGASAGDFCIKLKKLIPGAKIVAFEINRELIKKWNRNCKNLKNVHLMDKAIVGNHSKRKMPFYEFDDYERGNILGLYTNRFSYKKRYEVDTININKLFDLLYLDEIDYLKMDIEGCEHDIFKSIKPEILLSIHQISVETHLNTDRFIIEKILRKYMNIETEYADSSDDKCGYIFGRKK